MTIEDADAWARRLSEYGISIDGPMTRPDGAIQIFLRDPDDHVIELIEKR